MNSRAVKSSEHFHHSQDSLSPIPVNVDHPNSQTKATHLKGQVKDSLASAKDTLVHAKDQVKDHFGASTPQNQDAWTTNESLATTKERISQDRALPATTEIPLARSEIEKDSIDQEAVKEKLEDSFTAIEGMPGPGRYHPHPDRLENVGVTTKVGEKLKTGIISAKEKVFGASVERTETSETTAPILKADIKDSLASAQSSLKTGFRRGKKRVWRKKIQPIEGGMPGRNHPHAERFYAPTPSFTDRVKTGWAATGLMSAKNKIFGEKIMPIEGGMPGRNHPHPERFYAPTPSFTDRVQTSFLSAKKAIFGEKIMPIEGGMPGRNHPHPEKFEYHAPGLFTRIHDKFSGEKKTETVPVELQGQSEIDDRSIDQEAVKGQLEPTLAKETIHPLQGMPGPGRYHPMEESLRAKDQGVVEKLADNWKVYSVL